MKMDNFSVAMIDSRTNKAYQLGLDFTWEVAHGMVVDLRSKRDGNKYWIGKIEWLGNVQPTNTTEKKLEIKSHSDELLKEIEEYFKKHPRIVDTEPDPTTVELLKKLHEEVDFLKRMRINKP
jgi:hypothetical protein